MPLFYLIQFVLLAIIFLVFPIAVIYISNRLLRKKNKNIALTVTAMLSLGYLFFIYRDFYPSDRFYKDNFEYSTHFKFPASSEIIDKAAKVSILDIGGGEVYARVALSDADYKKFQFQMKSSQFQIETGFIQSDLIDNMVDKIKPLKNEEIYTMEQSGQETDIMFLNDHKSIIYYYTNW